MRWLSPTKLPGQLYLNCVISRSIMNREGIELLPTPVERLPHNLECSVITVSWIPETTTFQMLLLNRNIEKKRKKNKVFAGTFKIKRR